MKENITHHHLERIEASVAAISAALGLDRRDAYAYAYTRGRADAVTGAVRNKNINNTTDENKTKQVNKIDRGGLPESINLPIGLSEVVGAAESLMKIPGWYAAWQARPHPPEECPRFAAKSF